MFKAPMFKTSLDSLCFVLNLVHLDFKFVSDFDIRI